MATNTGLMTFEEFAKIPDRPGDPFSYELRHGELVRAAHAKHRHIQVQYCLRDLWADACRGSGVVGNELPYRALPEHEYREADVAYVSMERWRAISPDGCLLGAPELIAEIISPSNSRADLQDLQRLCLENGSQQFWTLNYDLVQVMVSTPDGITKTYKSGQEIPVQMFGSAIQVDDLFAV